MHISLSKDLCLGVLNNKNSAEVNIAPTLGNSYSVMLGTLETLAHRAIIGAEYYKTLHRSPEYVAEKHTLVLSLT